MICPQLFGFQYTCCLFQVYQMNWTWAGLHMTYSRQMAVPLSLQLPGVTPFLNNCKE